MSEPTKPRSFRIPGEILQMIDDLRRPAEGRGGVLCRAVLALWDAEGTDRDEDTAAWRARVERRLADLESAQSSASHKKNL